MSAQTIVQDDLLKWCEEVRALHVEHARPITSLDDPRAVSYASLAAARGFFPRNLKHEIEQSPEYAGIVYFENCFNLPMPPLSGPDWALVTPSLSVSWPEIHIEFVSEEERVNGITVQASVAYAVQVDAEGDEGAPVAAVQNITSGSANVTIMYDGHPIDFYGTTAEKLCSASAALALVAGMIGKEQGQ